jgi:hypothetical protein
MYLVYKSVIWLNKSLFYAICNLQHWFTWLGCLIDLLFCSFPFNLQIEWRRSWRLCSQKHVKHPNLYPSMELFTTSNCWRRTKNIFRSLLQLRNATFWQSNYFTPALLGYILSKSVHFCVKILLLLMLVGRNMLISIDVVILYFTLMLSIIFYCPLFPLSTKGARFKVLKKCM